MLRTRRILPAFWKSYLWKSGFVMCAPSKCADVSFSLCACCAGSCCASSDFMASNSNRRTLPCHTYLNLPLRSRDLALDLFISCLSLSLSLSLSQILSQILSHPLVLAQNKILDLQSNHRFGNNQIENLERKTGETRIGEFELKSRKPWRTRKRVEERGRGRVCGVLLTGAAGVFDSNVVAWLVFWFGLV